MRRARTPARDDELALEHCVADVVASARHLRSTPPPSSLEVVDLERSQVEHVLRVAARRVELVADSDQGERGTLGRCVRQPGPAIGCGTVAVEPRRLRFAVAAAREISAEQVELASMGGHARVVDGDRQRCDLTPGVLGDVVASHAAGGAAARDVAADDVDAVTDAGGADLGALQRARRERRPRGRGAPGARATVGAFVIGGEDDRGRAGDGGDGDRARARQDRSASPSPSVLGLDRALPSGAGENRQSRVARIVRVGARALTERELRPARVADQALMGAGVAQPRRGSWPSPDYCAASLDRPRCPATLRPWLKATRNAQRRGVWHERRGSARLPRAAPRAGPATASTGAARTTSASAAAATASSPRSIRWSTSSRSCAAPR